MFLEKVRGIEDDINDNIIDRQDAIRAAMLALITREHCLFLGPPGTAKSMLVREICNRIPGSNYFERLLTRFSTPEELFGPLSLAGLERDRYERITRGTLVEAHIAFVDEIFKANSSILNSLLTLINERLYQESGNVRRVPLLSLFGASNETPEDESLGALYDRFLIRLQIPYLVDDEDLRNLFTFEPAAPAASLSLPDLEGAIKEVAAVKISEETIEGLISLKRELGTTGIIVSDRRWRACTKLVRASAWMEGNSETDATNIECLKDALWNSPDQARPVERVIFKIANPLGFEALELLDAAEDLYKRRPEPSDPNLTSKLEPLLKGVGDIFTRLDGKIAKLPEEKTVKAQEVLTKVEKMHQELSRLALSSLSRLHLAPGA